MITSFLASFNLGLLVLPVFGFVAIFLGAFLFWRAGRRELVDSNLLFDVLVVGFLGGIVGGRVLDFLIGLVSNSFSIRRLLFFNAYGGFNFYGAIIGLLFAVFLFLRNRNHKILPIYDLLSAPAALSRAFYLAGLIISAYFKNNQKKADYFSAMYFFGYLIVFWILKRLEHKKRFVGFFIAYFLILASVLEIALAFFGHESLKIYRQVPLLALIWAFGLIAGLVIYWRGGSPKKSVHLKSILGMILLAVFKIKRVLTSLPEADQMAKNIVLSPLLLAKALLSFVKLVMHEILASLFDLVHAFGFGK